MDNFDELKGNVAQALEAKGVLSSIRAQLRAAVFTAINEEEAKADEQPGLSSLKQLHGDDDGLTMLAVVQDFLSFYNLQYSLNVLRSEASLSEEIPSPDRAALIRKLQLRQDNARAPILASLLSSAPRDVSASPVALSSPSAGSAASPAATAQPAPDAGSPDDAAGAVSPTMSSPGAGLSSPSPLKQGGAPDAGALHHSPSSQQLLGAQAGTPQAEATDDDLAAALSAALQEEDVPPPAAQKPAFGLSALPSLSLGTPGSLEGLRAEAEGEGAPNAPRGERPTGGHLDVSDSFEDTLGSSAGGKQATDATDAAGGSASASDEEYGDDEDWEEEELPDEVSDDGSVPAGEEEEQVLSTAVPIAQLAASPSPGKRSPGGVSGDEFALSMGDSRSMGDSGALDAGTAAAPADGANAGDAHGGAADGGPLESSWTEEGGAPLQGYDVQEAVQE